MIQPIPKDKSACTALKKPCKVTEGGKHTIDEQA